MIVEFYKDTKKYYDLAWPFFIDMMNMYNEISNNGKCKTASHQNFAASKKTYITFMMPKYILIKLQILTVAGFNRG